MITFDVLGIPRPQGSKKAIKAKSGKVIVVESSGDNFAAWRNAVAEAAQRAASERGVTRSLSGPLRLEVLFRFPMPASGRTKAVRLAGIAWKTTQPDTSKLVRTIEDAITSSALVGNDSCFVVHHLAKVEVAGAWIGATISIEAIPPFVVGGVIGAMADTPSLFEVPA